MLSSPGRSIMGFGTLSFLLARICDGRLLHPSTRFPPSFPQDVGVHHNEQRNHPGLPSLVLPQARLVVVVRTHNHNTSRTGQPCQNHSIIPTMPTSRRGLGRPIFDAGGPRLMRSDSTISRVTVCWEYTQTQLISNPPGCGVFGSGILYA